MRRQEGTHINDEDTLHEINKALRALTRLKQRLLATRRKRYRIEAKKQELLGFQQLKDLPK